LTALTDLQFATHLKLSIALGIFEELQKNLSTLLWPSALGSRSIVVLGLKEDYSGISQSSLNFW